MARQNPFKGKVAHNAQKTKGGGGATYGYLQLPKGINMYKVVPGGRSLLAFMPYEVTDPRHPDHNDEYGVALPGTLWWKRPFAIIRNVGPNKETVISPVSIGKPCPITEYRKKMLDNGNGGDETDAIKLSWRNLYCVIPWGEKDYEEKPHLLDISQAMFGDLLAEELNERPEYEVFPDIEEGFDIRIRWDSKTIGNSKPFPEASRIDFEDRESFSDDILKQIPCLDDILIIHSYEKLYNMFHGIDEADAATEGVSETSPAEKEEPQRTRRTTETGEPQHSRRTAPPAETPKETNPVDVCPACEGGGKNSRGGACKPCGGSGKLVNDGNPEPRRTRTAPAEEPKRETATQQKETPPTQEGGCPHNISWGNPLDDNGHCSVCTLFAECLEAGDVAF